MPVQSVPGTLSIGEMNSIKNKMALTFMHALNSTVNYHFNENARELDGLGLDLTLVSALVGQRRTIASGANQINIQLKGVAESSSSMFEESEDSIRYRLKADLLKYGFIMYLVIVVLPPSDELENWRHVNETDVMIRSRAYYIKVDGRLRSGWLTIPKSQKLTPESYKALFTTASNELVV